VSTGTFHLIPMCSPR